MNKVTLLKGDCLNKLKGLKDNSVDSVVTDPPYEIGFMGSGSTGKASVREGMDFIGIEREDEYMEISKTRILHEQMKHNYREFFNIQLYIIVIMIK